MFQADYDNFYGKYLEEEFPNVTFQIVQYHHDKEESFFDQLKNTVEQEQPDIVATADLLSTGKISGMFLSLEPYLKRDKSMLKAVPSSIVETIRSFSPDNQIYGWSGTFNANLLVYNKSLFDRYNVDYPNDNLSWRDLFKLVRSFPTENEQGQPLYGLLVPGQVEPERRIHSLISQAGTSEKLRLLDTDRHLPTIETDAWKEIWNAAIEAYQTGAISNMPALDPNNQVIDMPSYEQQYQLFLNGQAAVTLAGTGLLNILSEQRQIEWGLASSPGTYINLSLSTWSIPVQSAHSDQAWEVIRFLTSEVMNRHRSEWDKTFMPVQTQLLDKKYAVPLSLYFTKAASVDEVLQEIYYPSNASFYQKYSLLSEEKLKQILEGKLSTDQALRELQQQLAPFAD